MIQQSIFGEISKVGNSISLLKEFEPMALQLNPEGYYLCYSGGKDSDFLLDITLKAGVKFSANYNVTGVDPKECIKHIKKVRAELKQIGINLYMRSPNKFTTGIYKGLPYNMWRLIVHKVMPPTMICRYCCDKLKEHGGYGSLCLTGVRWAESTKRKQRRPLEIVTKKKVDKKLFNDNDEGRMQFENCMQKGKRVLNPIVQFEDYELWDHVKTNNLNLCDLYFGENPVNRIGCIGCPMGGSKGMEEDFQRYPQYKKMYIQAYDLMLEHRKLKGLPQKSWKCGEDVLEWQMYGSDKEHRETFENQIDLFDSED
jgi:phosphoadenosine phosphosulfate reductase